MIGEHNYNTYKVDKQIVREKVPVHDLQMGMYVVELDRPWVDTPFLFQGFLISSEEEIDQLCEYCEFVFVDMTQTKIKFREKRRQDRTGSKDRRGYKTAVEKELPKALENYKQAQLTVDNTLRALRFSHEIDTVEIKTAVRGCVKSVLRNPNAMMWLTQIKDQDNYTAEHSLRVSIMAVALGQELDLLEQELEDLGMAAMLHDVGKVKIPLEILNKEGSLNKVEYEIMKSHAEEGRKMLMSKKNVPNIAVDVAYNHHEQLDGSGYPRGISADKIPYFAKIVAVVDVFDAITSDRVYCTGRSTLEALRILYDHRGKQFDEDIVRTFIRLVGIYPPGHIVELSNGEAGIILSCLRTNKLRPKVLIVRNADKKLCREKIIDLSKDHKDENGKPILVREIYKDGQFGIELNEYKAKGLKFGIATGEEPES